MDEFIPRFLEGKIMYHQRCHFPVSGIEQDGIELIGKGIFLLEIQIHKVLLRAVHEASFFLNRFDELLIQSFAVCLLAHKSGIEIQMLLKPSTISEANLMAKPVINIF